MKNLIYENFANYYINKFCDYKNLKISKNWANDDIMHVVISSNLPYYEFFMGLYPNMISFDGMCVCNHGIEFDNIETIDKDVIYALLDEESELIKKFINEGILIFGYKNNELKCTMSTDVIDREKALKNIDIKSFYTERKFDDQPSFDELDKIELKDFYGNVLYDYNSPSSKVQQKSQEIALT